ncbi:hypothetical protein [Zavarzinella formosa]|uniref:hypothetical protein n=1 Tax=Zavarzinella formosa TaxID=360055 RepID=UPI0002E6D15C|nr:hypothetical protein [Zavarzinella formosa]
MRIPLTTIGRCVCLFGLLAAGCGEKSASTPAADTKTWKKVESWQVGQPLPPGAKASRPEPPPGTPPELTVIAEVIAQEAVAGTGERYFHKVVQVEGVTVPVPKDKFPTTPVKFALSGVPRPYSTDPCAVACVPAPGGEEQAKALPLGRKVRVIGYVTNMTNDVVGITNCTVTDLGAGSEPTPVRSAADVTAEFVKDETAALAKHGLSGKKPAVLLLKGKVTESAKNGDTGTFRLAGSEGASVLVTMRVTEYTKPPEVGKTITAGGLFEGYDAKSKSLKLSSGSAIP